MSRRRLKLKEYSYAHSDFSSCSIDTDLSISRSRPINLSHLDQSSAYAMLLAGFVAHDSPVCNNAGTLSPCNATYCAPCYLI